MKITKMSKLEEKKGDKLPDVEKMIRSKVKVPEDLVDFLKRNFIKLYNDDIYNRVIQHYNWHLILATPNVFYLEPIHIRKHTEKYNVIVTYNRKGVLIASPDDVEYYGFTKQEIDNKSINGLEHLVWYANKRFNIK